MIRRVRAVMRAFGYEVTERPAPEVDIDPACVSAGLYYPAAHRIVLRSAGDTGSLAHELTHSQQANIGPPGYLRADGTIDAGAWADDPLELQALAVEAAICADLDLEPGLLDLVVHYARTRGVPTDVACVWIACGSRAVAESTNPPALQPQK